MVVAELTDDGHARRIYAATGPRKLSFAEAVEELAEATGRRIRYMRASTERYAALVAGRDVPEEVVVRLGRVIDELVAGRNGAADPGVERAIGSESRDVADDSGPAASTRKPATATDGRRATEVQCLGEYQQRLSLRRGSSTAVTRIDARDASNLADPVVDPAGSRASNPSAAAAKEESR